MKAISFYIFYALIKTLSWLPSSVLYALASGLYYVLYYAARYRRKIVYKNLRQSFPQKSEDEIQTIAKKFYRHLADVFIEYIILAKGNAKEVEKRVQYVNPEVVSSLLNAGKSVIIVSAHYGNWELCCNLAQILKQHEDECIAVYKRLHNKYMDKWFVKMRSAFGSTPVEMRKVFMHLRTNKRLGKVCSVVLIADQLPKSNEMEYAVTFLNHAGTVVYLGAERLAKMLDMAVVYGDICKTSRGHYSVTFVPLTQNPQQTEKYEITNMHIQYLEEKLRKQPEYWMWSHNRWKRTKIN